MNIQNKPSILLLGAGHSEMPLAKSLKDDFGYRVVSAGNTLNYLTKDYIDNHYFVDYSNFNECLRLFEEENCINVISGCNDFAYMTKIKIQATAGLVSEKEYSNSKKIHYKDKLLSSISEIHGIDRCELTFHVNNIEMASMHLKENKSQFPFIVKPTDLSGGKGMSIIRSQDELTEAVDQAKIQTRRETLYIEKYFCGTNHAISCIFDKDGLVFYFVDLEQHDISHFAVSGACSLSGLKKTSIKNVIKLVCNIWEEHSLGAGLLHVQFINSDSGPIILEVTQRCPGDLYPYLVEYSTGFPYVQSYILLSTNPTEIIHRPQTIYTKNYLRQCVYNFPCQRRESNENIFERNNQIFP